MSEYTPSAPGDRGYGLGVYHGELVPLLDCEVSGRNWMDMDSNRGKLFGTSAIQRMFRYRGVVLAKVRHLVSAGYAFAEGHYWHLSTGWVEYALTVDAEIRLSGCRCHEGLPPEAFCEIHSWDEKRRA